MGKKRTILVLEASDAGRKLLTKGLEKKGFLVVCREDGRRLVDVVAETHPDAILMSIVLKDIDGFSLASALKASVHTALIPVIAVTACAMPGAREQALEAGFDDYFAKPIDLPLLVSTIRRLIKLAGPHIPSAWSEPG